MKRLVTLAVVATAFTSSGCGTFAHSFCGPVKTTEVQVGSGTQTVTEPYPRYFGGVWTDGQMIREGRYYFVADLPFSLAADAVVAVVTSLRPWPMPVTPVRPDAPHPASPATAP